MLTILPLIFSLTAAEPDPTKNAQPPVVKFQQTAGGEMIFEVSNPNAIPLPYVGYRDDSFDKPPMAGRISPLYSVELHSGGAWKPSPLGWCKTGVGPVSIPAKGKVTFQASLPQGEWDQVRIGLSWFPAADSKIRSTAWSNPVTRKDAAPAK